MKITLALLLAMFCASAHGAYITNGQDKVDPSISTNPVRIIKVVGADYSGNTGLGNSITGTVKADQGAAGTVGWPMQLTTVPRVDMGGSSGVANVAANGGTLVTNAAPMPVSFTSFMSGYGSVSTHAVPMTVAYSQDITAALGVAAGLSEFCFGAIGANNFWYEWSSSSTPPTTYGYLYSISTTPICKRDLAPGTYFHASVTAATLSATVKVIYSVKRP